MLSFEVNKDVYVSKIISMWRN